MISGFVELVCRVVLIFVMPRFFGMESIYFVEVFAWSGATILLVGSCLKRIRDLKEGEESSC